MLAEQIRSSVEAENMSYGESVFKVTISIGIAQYHTDMTRYEDLINDAETALHQAKNAGRNRIHWAEQPALPRVVANRSGL